MNIWRRKFQTARQLFNRHGWRGIYRKTQHQRLERREEANYQKWIIRHDTLTESDRAAIRRRIAGLRYKPLISIVMPVYDVGEKWLRLCIESVLNQLYENWEFCIADDGSPSPHIGQVLKEYAARDSRLKIVFREQNGHISAASNSALELSAGEFIALLDHDDELSEHALYFIAEELNRHPELDLIYSDEDKIDENGRRFAPNFKPNWSPDLFYSLNLLTHLSVYRADIVRKVGGFRLGTEGSQDYDLGLRVTEEISEHHISHIPHILYHWRAISGSVALASGEKSYAHDRAREVLRSHLERKNIRASVVKGAYQYHRIKYDLPPDLPKVSLILAVRDKNAPLAEILKDIDAKTDYENYELLSAIHSDENPSNGLFGAAEQFKDDEKMRSVYRSRLSGGVAGAFNKTAEACDGEIFVFLDGVFEPQNSDWLRELVSFVRQPNIGAAGAKLLNSDQTVRNGGVILGADNLIGFAHSGLARAAAGNLARAQITNNFSAVSGVLAVRRDIFIENGGFDRANFANGLSDVDFCLRLGAKNMRIVWLPSAELVQLSNSSTEEILKDENAPEMKFFKQKWRHLIVSDPFYNPNLSLEDSDFALEMTPRLIKPWK